MKFSEYISVLWSVTGLVVIGMIVAITLVGIWKIAVETLAETPESLEGKLFKVLVAIVTIAIILTMLLASLNLMFS